MATSFQAFPPPVSVYPTTETNQPESPYHSNGSYGTVFVVLAVIIVVSAIACVLGRLCGKRSKRSSGQPKAKNKNKHQSHGHNKAPPHSNGRSKERDVEFGFGPKGGEDIELGFGFDKKIPKAKVAPNGHGKGQRPQMNGPGQFGWRPMGHQQIPMGHQQLQMGHQQRPMGHQQIPMGHQQLPMMECPRNFQ